MTKLNIKLNSRAILSKEHHSQSRTRAGGADPLRTRPVFGRHEKLTCHSAYTIADTHFNQTKTFRKTHTHIHTTGCSSSGRDVTGVFGLLQAFLLEDMRQKSLQFVGHSLSELSVCCSFLTCGLVNLTSTIVLWGLLASKITKTRNWHSSK